MNKQQLISDLSLHVDLAESTKASAERVLDFILETIQQEVANGNTVTIAGFGTFLPYTRLSGERVPKFRAYKGFKDRVAL